MKSNPKSAGAASEAPAGALQDVLDAAWRDYYSRSRERPPHTQARDFLHRDLNETFARIIPADASVLEVGCGEGDLLASLPQTNRMGIDYLPATIEHARARHPDIRFEVADITADAGARIEPAPAGGWDAVVCDRLCHSVVDVKALLTGLKRQMAPGGRIYMTAFNYAWEVPVRIAEMSGWKRPGPISNWLSDTDYRNLFDIVGLEVVRYEDRVLLPLEVPALTPALNRYLVRAPGMSVVSLYRIYILRDRGSAVAPRRATVSVIVPTRNEAGNVAAALARTPVMGSGTELIFVEGHSSDDTWATIQAEMARYKGPLKLSAYQQTGKGKGDAVRLGFSKASGDILMILDADLTVPPEDLPRFFAAIRDGKGEFVNGVRLTYPMEERAMRFANLLGNKFFSLTFSWLLEQPIKDTLCGTKVLRRDAYQALVANRAYFGDFDPFGDFDLLFGAAKLGLEIVEVPIRYRERTYGTTNIQRWRHGWLLLKMCVFAAGRIKFV